MQTNLTDQRMYQARMVLDAPVAQVEAPSRGIQMLHSLNIVPQSQYISSALAKKHDFTLNCATQTGLPIQFLGYAPAFDGVKVFRGQGTDWALMNVSDDPIFTRRDKFPMPRVVVQSVRQAVKAGLDFDAIFIAHEIPSGQIRSGTPIPYELIMPPPPRRTLQRLHHLEKAISIVQAAAMLAASVPVVAVSFAAAVTQLDPILFGLHVDYQNCVQGQPFAMWYYLTHWVWD
jgi:hypothetical protein